MNYRLPIFAVAIFSTAAWFFWGGHSGPKEVVKAEAMPTGARSASQADVPTTVQSSLAKSHGDRIAIDEGTASSKNDYQEPDGWALFQAAASSSDPDVIYRALRIVADCGGMESSDLSTLVSDASRLDNTREGLTPLIAARRLQKRCAGFAHQGTVAATAGELRDRLASSSTTYGEAIRAAERLWNRVDEPNSLATVCDGLSDKSTRQIYLQEADLEILRRLPDIPGLTSKNSALVNNAAITMYKCEVTNICQDDAGFLAACATAGICDKDSMNDFRFGSINSVRDRIDSRLQELRGAIDNNKCKQFLAGEQK